MYFWVAVMYSDTSIKWNRHAVPCANLFTLNSHFTAPSRPVFHNISSAGHKTTATHSPQGHEHTAALSHCVLQSLCANTMDPITLFHCVSCKMPFSNFFFFNSELAFWESIVCADCERRCSSPCYALFNLPLSLLFYWSLFHCFPPVSFEAPCLIGSPFFPPFLSALSTRVMFGRSDLCIGRHVVYFALI